MCYDLVKNREGFVVRNLNIPERMEHYHTTGLSLSIIDACRINKIENFGVLEAGTHQKVNNHSIFSACSISKLLTAVLVMVLAEQAVLDLDEDVNNSLISWKIPNNSLTKHKKVTLRNLLSHQAGLIDPKDSFMEQKSKQIPTMVEILTGRTMYCQSPIEVQYEPESDFQYSDAGFCIIQLLIEDITGKLFAEVIEELIFLPLKMTNSGFPKHISEEASGYYSCGHDQYGNTINRKYPIYPYDAAAGLWLTTSDLSQVVIELMNALCGQSNIGLSASTAREVISSQGCRGETGLGVFLDGAEISSLGWGIGFQCMMVAYPYMQRGLIIMTNANSGVHQLKGIIGEIYDSYIRTYDNQ